MTELDGLTANTTYAYKAFVTYYGITVLSEETIFTTLPENDTIEDHVEEYLLSSIKLYPNPAKQYIDVILEEESGPCQIELYDSQSRKVREMSMAGKSVRIPLGHLSSGIYFVQIKGDKQMITKRFVKE